MSIIFTNIKRIFSGRSKSGAFEGRLGSRALPRMRRVIEDATTPVVESLEERMLMSAAYPTIGLTGGSAVAITNNNGSYIVGNGTEFGSTDLKKAVTETFVIKNTGLGVLDLTGFNRVAISGAQASDFSITAQPAAVVVPNSTTSFKVQFQAATTGLAQAALTIFNDTTGANPFVVNIEGTGTSAPLVGVAGNGKSIASGDVTISTLDNTSFGSTEAALGSITKTFTISNTGSANLTLSGGTNGLVQVSGTAAADYTVTQPGSATIIPGGSETFGVVFAPAGNTGSQNATLTIPNSDTNHASFTFNISGSGQALPVMNVQGMNGTVGTSIPNGSLTASATNATSFANSEVTLGSATDTFTIQNVGSEALSLSGTPTVTITGANKQYFSVVAQPATNVAAAGSETFQIKFQPTAVGTMNATVSITDNASNNTGTNHAYTFAINGVGVTAPKIQVLGGTTVIASGDTNLATLDGTQFGAIDISAGAITHTFTIKNLASAALNLTGGTNGLSISGPDAADFTISQEPSATIAPINNVAPGAPAPRRTRRHRGSAIEASLAPMAAVRHARVVHHRPHMPASPGTGASNSTTFAITFDPSSASSSNKAAVVTIASNDTNTASYTFDIGGEALSTSVLNVEGGAGNTLIASGSTSAASVTGTDFGNVDKNNPVTKTFILKDIGSQPMTLGSTPVSVTGGDWTVTQPSGTSIASGGTSSFSITLTPGSVVAEAATVTVASDDPASPYTFAVKGNGVSVPVAGVQGLNGTNLVTIAAGDGTFSTGDGTDFGSTELANGSVTETFVIKNNGSSAMTFSNTTTAKVVIGSGATDFSIVEQPTPSGTIAPGGTADIAIRFKPTNSGSRTGTVSILTNDPVTHNFTFGVKGTAVRAGVIQLSGNGTTIVDGDTNTVTLDGTEFGSADPSAGPVTHTFSIKNIGSDALNLLSGTNASAITFSGTSGVYFSVPSTAQPRVSLVSGGLTTFNVVFSPSTNALGLQATTMTIASNTFNTNAASYTVDLEGTTATAPVINIQGNSHTIANGDTKPLTSDGTDFGSTGYNGGFVTESFNIQNTGSAVMTLGNGTSHVTVGTGSANFTILTQPADTIAAGASSTFTVEFAPTAAGVKTNTISVASDAVGSPYVFAVRGTGVTAPAMSVTGEGSNIADGDTDPSFVDGTDMGPVETNTGSASATFSINDTGSAPLTLTGTPKVVVTGPDAADFTILTQPSSGTVAASTGETFVVKFKPTTDGTRTATISINSNDPNTSPYTFQVQGEAVDEGVLQVSGAKVLTNGQTATSTTDSTDFGSSKANSGTVTETFVLKNIGSAALDLTNTPLVLLGGVGGASVSGDFQVTTQPDTSLLAINGTTSVSITFTPTSVGAQTAVVTVLDDDPTGTFTFNIKGTGTL